MWVVVKFVAAMIVCTVVCTVVWSYCVQDVLYHCTDSIPLDYLSGSENWVHGAVVGQPGNYGDTIAPGWTLGRLEGLWYLMFGGSVAVSAGMAWVSWNSVVGKAVAK